MLIKHILMTVNMNRPQHKIEYHNNLFDRESVELLSITATLKDQIIDSLEPVTLELMFKSLINIA